MSDSSNDFALENFKMDLEWYEEAKEAMEWVWKNPTPMCVKNACATAVVETKESLRKSAQLLIERSCEMRGAR